MKTVTPSKGIKQDTTSTLSWFSDMKICSLYRLRLESAEDLCKVLM